MVSPETYDPRARVLRHTGIIHDTAIFVIVQKEFCVIKKINKGNLKEKKDLVKWFKINIVSSSIQDFTTCTNAGDLSQNTRVKCGIMSQKEL